MQLVGDASRNVGLCECWSIWTSNYCEFFSFFTFWFILPRIWCVYNFTIILFLIFQQEESEVGLPGGNGQLLTLGLGLLFTALAAAYVTRLAKVISIFFLNFLNDQKCVSMIDELTLSCAFSLIVIWETKP